MPLSEEEQRVFAEIERRLSREAPRSRSRRLHPSEAFDAGEAVTRAFRVQSRARVGRVAGALALVVFSLLAVALLVGVHPLLALGAFGGVLRGCVVAVRALGGDVLASELGLFDESVPLDDLL